MRRTMFDGYSTTYLARVSKDDSHETAIRSHADRALLCQVGQQAPADISRNTEQTRRLIWRQRQPRKVLDLGLKFTEKRLAHFNVAPLVRDD